jgi:multidrug efflux pump subunit AcrA (membrane-fusion protein)
MYVNVSLEKDLGKKIAVPEEAVFSTGERHIVFVATPEGGFEPREVEPGPAADDLRVIEKGLGEGERVVVSGNFLIDSESRLKAALQDLGGEAAQPYAKQTGGHQHG